MRHTICHYSTALRWLEEIYTVHDGALEILDCNAEEGKTMWKIILGFCEFEGDGQNKRCMSPQTVDKMGCTDFRRRGKSSWSRLASVVDIVRCLRPTSTV